MRTSMTRFVVSSIFFLQALFVYDVAAQTLSVEAGENNINLGYKNTEVEDSDSALSIDAQLLYSKQNNHQDLLASFGLTTFTPSSNAIKSGVGFRLIAADPLDYYLTAVAVGVELAYRTSIVPEFKFEAGLYYAGESLTFSDGDSLSLLVANMDFEMSRHASIRLGYRRIKTQRTNGISDDFDRGVYLGLLWAF